MGVGEAWVRLRGLEALRGKKFGEKREEWRERGSKEFGEKEEERRERVRTSQRGEREKKREGEEFREERREKNKGREFEEEREERRETGVREGGLGYTEFRNTKKMRYTSSLPLSLSLSGLYTLKKYTRC